MSTSTAKPELAVSIRGVRTGVPAIVAEVLPRMVKIVLPDLMPRYRNSHILFYEWDVNVPNVFKMLNSDEVAERANAGLPYFIVTTIDAPKT
jgi:hypothetical protein